MQPPTDLGAPPSGARAACFTCGAPNPPDAYACAACGVSLRLAPPRRPARPAPLSRAPVVRAPASSTLNTLDIEIDAPDASGRLLAGAASPAPEASWSALQTVDESADGLAPLPDVDISPLAERAPSIAGRLRDLEVPASMTPIESLMRASRAPSRPARPLALLGLAAVAAGAAAAGYLALPRLVAPPA
ncbi:MAG: hypothetical protein FJ138_12825, partial [Deltaproteobacteria bacterium]|nr:hypothetical protein [Deltaproteobacteria bacterium]